MVAVPVGRLSNTSKQKVETKGHMKSQRIFELPTFSVLCAAFALAIAPAAFAQNQTVTTTRGLLDNFSSGYYGYFAGPAVNRLGGSQAPDIRGTNPGSDAVNLYNNVELAYKTGDGSRIFAQGRFLLTPVVGQSLFTLLDPRVGYGFRMVRLGDFNLGGNALFEPNVSASTSRIGGVRVSVNAEYTPSGSRLSFDAATFAIYYLHGSNLALTDRRWNVYVAPAATYMMGKNLGARLYVEAIDVRGNVNGTSDDLMDKFNIQPRITWDVMKGLNLQPYVKLYPARLALDNTSVGIEINGTIL